MKLENYKNSTLIETILPKIENKVLSAVKDTTLVLGFAILTGIAAQLKIEIGAVPITMQTLVVLLSGALLGSKKGLISQFVYILGGLTALPWFARGGGMAYILSPTFGYILGFALAAYLVGILTEKGWDRDIRTAVLAMLAGNVIIYIPGLLWLAKFVGISKVLTVGFYPFILGDLIKIFLAGLILPFGWKIINLTTKIKSQNIK